MNNNFVRAEQARIDTIPARFGLDKASPIHVAQTGSIGDVTASAGFQKIDGSIVKGLFVFVRLQNTGNQNASASIDGLRIEDSEGYLVNIASAGDFIARGAAMAGVPVPRPQSENFYVTGTVRDASAGSVSIIEGRGYRGNPYDVSSGYTQARALRTRELGMEMMEWGQSNWLRSKYDLAPGRAAVGAVFVETPDVRFPLTVVFSVNGRPMTVKTRAE